MAFASPWEDQDEQNARTGRSSGANPYGPPGVHQQPQGAPRNPTFSADSGGGGGGSPWQGYTPGYLGETGGAQPGSGWGYYYANSGRPTGAGGISAAANALKFSEAEQTDLSKTAMERARLNIEGADPAALAAKMYQARENTALRAGQAAREQQLAENADMYAMRGMTGSGGEAGSAADIRRAASQARLSALDQAQAESMQFGEQAASGRLESGVPWQSDESGRREFNAAKQWEAEQMRREMQARAASAAAGGYERIIEIPGFGEVPESMIPYLMEFGGMA
jgi:hypothetical protein